MFSSSGASKQGELPSSVLLTLPAVSAVSNTLCSLLLLYSLWWFGAQAGRQAVCECASIHVSPGIHAILLQTQVGISVPKHGMKQ
jgi:hypothetical protein